MPDLWCSSHRTIWAGSRCVGVMDTPELAVEVVEAHNRAVDKAAMEAFKAAVVAQYRVETLASMLAERRRNGVA